MAKAPVDIRSLARAHTELALRTLAGIAATGANEGARVAACAHLLDRGWGKAPTTHTGENGEGDIRVIVRHIIAGRDVIDAVPIETIVPQLMNREGSDD